MSKLFYFFVLITIISCSTNPYKKSNQAYDNQLENLKETISKKEEIILKDLNKQSLKTKDSSYFKQLNPLQDSISKVGAIDLKQNIPSEWVGTVNFNLRKPNMVIIHHTAQESVDKTIYTFTTEKTQVSAHYVIGKDGNLVHMLNDYLRAWHAGNSSWGKNTDINSCSIGIELDNDGFSPFSEAQINTLIALLTKLKKDYNIPTQNFIGHADIAPNRKNDPNVNFPWKLLAEKGFGVWQDDVLENVPLNFNAEQALRIIGYDTKNLPAAIQAFKLHYVKTEVDSVLNQLTLNILYSVYKKQ